MKYKGFTLTRAHVSKFDHRRVFAMFLETTSVDEVTAKTKLLLVKGDWCRTSETLYFVWTEENSEKYYKQHLQLQNNNNITVKSA